MSPAAACTVCSYENPAGSKFCLECGAAIGRQCARCSAELPATAKFCNECGAAVAVSAGVRTTGGNGARTPVASIPSESVSDALPGAHAVEPQARGQRPYTPKHLADKILSSRSALEGERKQVTVLFADVQGSLELSEQLDPEEWHQIMDRFFEILTDGVHRFEGTVNQYTGDGIMALFGAPIAHEDHAQRACYTALHLREELRRYAQDLRRDRGLDFIVRMGVNSGDVVIGKIGDDLRMDYTAQGHVVGLAARMEQLAEAGRIYVARDTAALVGGYFRLDDLGEFSLKGVREPVRVHALEGVGRLRTRLDLSRARGFSRFVGRADEMGALEAALAQALEGNGQVVGIVADAGTGKSRLCYEFTERCRARGMRVDQAHGLAHGQGIPFLPVFEYYRGVFGVSEQDSPQAAREKIAGRLLLLDPAFAEMLPLIFDFLGLPDPQQPAPRLEPEVRQRQLLGFVRRLTRATSERESVVGLIEDLHWIDGASNTFLDTYVEAIAGTRTLLVVNFRPEYHASWMQKSYYRQIPLLPLGPEASDALLCDLLGTDESLSELGERIKQRTGGNPFFIEEIVQSLIESACLEGARGAYRLAKPVGDEALPPTVQAILAARIDRLGEREKGVLQSAAVIGKEFTRPLLQSTTDVSEQDLTAALDTLLRAELVYETALYPDAEYSFKHPLTQEVAYRSQLGERRAKIHAAVARTIADTHRERLDEKAATLAYHWEAAGEALEAARWHRRAALWARVSDAREAMRHWQSTAALLEALPVSREASALALEARGGILNLGWRLGMSDADADRLLREGRALAESVDDPSGLARLLMYYAVTRCLAGGNPQEYLARIGEVADIAERLDDIALRVSAIVCLAYGNSLTGNLKAYLDLIEQGIELSRANPRIGTEIVGFSPYPWFLAARAIVSFSTGRLDEAEQSYVAAMEVARSMNARENLGWIASGRASLAAFRGDVRAALEHGLQGAQIAEAVGTGMIRVFAAWGLGTALVSAGQWEEACETLEHGLARMRSERSNLIIQDSYLSVLAEAYLGLGSSERAREAAEAAVELAEQAGRRVAAIDAHLVRARVALHGHGLAARSAIDESLARAAALIEETGARVQEPVLHLARAELALLGGAGQVRERELQEAEHLFAEMGAPIRAGEVAMMLGTREAAR